ncbi:MAG: ABC transporter permease [Armatimonadota bacterium]
MASSSSAAFIARRLLQAIPLVIGIVLINFVLIRLAPGDPLAIMAGEQSLTPELEALLRSRYGLDRPILEQFLRYLATLLRGDFGNSIFFHRPVLHLIVERIPATLLLTVPPIALATLAGLWLGTASARRPYSLTDSAVTVGSLMGYSLPVFWSAQVLLGVFALRLGWFPAQGMFSVREQYTGLQHWIDVARHLTLPALTLAATHVALITRLTRANMIEVLREDFVRTARSKGLSERQVVLSHALRNAVLPVVTVVGLSFGFILSGAVLTETVFGWPGLGRLMFEAIFRRDYPVLLGMLVVVSMTVIIANLATDLVYSLIDPRIQYR